MKIKLILTETRADYALLDLAREGDQDAKDKLKRIGKRRGVDLSIIQPILTDLKEKNLPVERVATYIRSYSITNNIDDDLIQYLPYFVKFAKNELKINYAHLAYLLAYYFQLYNSKNEKVKNILRKYASKSIISSYDFAKVIDRSYHPDTLRGIMKSEFSIDKLNYLDGYLYRFRNIPEKESIPAEAELSRLRSTFMR